MTFGDHSLTLSKGRENVIATADNPPQGCVVQEAVSKRAFVRKSLG